MWFRLLFPSSHVRLPCNRQSKAIGISAILKRSIQQDLSCMVLSASNRYIPGHIHAFYLEYVYYDRKEKAQHGRLVNTRAPGVYSDNISTGGQGYGTINQPAGTVQ
jgi:hypothetical protein